MGRKARAAVVADGVMSHERVHFQFVFGRVSVDLLWLGEIDDDAFCSLGLVAILC